MSEIIKKSWEVFIPFTGFYNSTHDWHMDNAIDLVLEENEDASYKDLEIKYPEFMKEYAEAYVNEFTKFMLHEHGVFLSAKFKEVASPKEYNFETDRIVAEIDEDSLLSLITHTDLPKLTKEVFETLKIRDGFFTGRSNDVATWLFRGLQGWDTVELGMLLDHFVDLNVIMEPDNAHEIASRHIGWKEAAA